MPRYRLSASIFGLTLLMATATAVTAGPAAAHPLGNLSVNTYDGVIVEASAVRVDHVEDLAEIPAVVALQAADANGDGAADDAEIAVWEQARCRAATDRISLKLSGADYQLKATTARASKQPGQAGLPVLRVECVLEAATAPIAEGSRLTVAIASVSDVGWREITVAGDRTTVEKSDVAATTISDRLIKYPGDLSTQPDQRKAEAVMRPGGPALAAAPTGEGLTAALQRGVDGLTIAVEDLVNRAGAVMILLLLGGAILLGVMHAVAPGHGKTIVAASVLAGQRNLDWRARFRHAITLGTSVTIAHTGSVLTVGAILFVLGSVVPARLFPILTIISGVLVIGLGIALARGKPGHTHNHSSQHTGAHLDSHSHVDLRQREPEHALAHEHTVHHSDPHAHSHAFSHSHGEHQHERTGAADRAAAVEPGSRLSRSRLMIIGIAGGLVPSPTALLLFLATVAIGRAWVGLLAVVAFGIGMAATLTTVGLLAAAGGQRLFAYAESRGLPKRLTIVAPRIAGLAIVAAGVLAIIRGLAQTITI